MSIAGYKIYIAFPDQFLGEIASSSSKVPEDRARRDLQHAAILAEANKIGVARLKPCHTFGMGDDRHIAVIEKARDQILDTRR